MIAFYDIKYNWFNRLWATWGIWFRDLDFMWKQATVNTWLCTSMALLFCLILRTMKWKVTCNWLRGMHLVYFQRWGKMVNFSAKLINHIVLRKPFFVHLLTQSMWSDYAIKEKPLLGEDMQGGPDYIVLKSLDTDGIRLIGSVLGQSIALDYFVSQVWNKPNGILFPILWLPLFYPNEKRQQLKSSHWKFDIRFLLLSGWWLSWRVCRHKPWDGENRNFHYG